MARKSNILFKENEETQKFINLAKRANRRIKAYKNAGEVDEVFEKEIEILRSATGSRGQYITTNANRIRGYLDSQKVLGIRELEFFINWDISSPVGKEEQEEKKQKSYKEFIANPNFKDVTYDEWRQLVEIFGALGDDIITKFHSDDFADTINTYRKQGFQASSLVEIAQTAVAKREGLQKSEVLEVVREEIKKELEKNKPKKPKTE